MKYFNEEALGTNTIIQVAFVPRAYFLAFFFNNKEIFHRFIKQDMYSVEKWNKNKTIFGFQITYMAI